MYESSKEDEFVNLDRHYGTKICLQSNQPIISGRRDGDVTPHDMKPIICDLSLPGIEAATQRDKGEKLSMFNPDFSFFFLSIYLSFSFFFFTGFKIINGAFS
ncbi:uncharacterized protein LOC143249767 [Tachypleus tridentatus]|uniref:uncharacterized protein LOC143249767 n=1 Tax=Tachypleus tridentatus TaxID=6853 RepID=UPI003FD6BE32